MKPLDVDQLAARVRQVPDVADLSGGTVGEVATYLPGRRVAGIREHEGRVEIHLALGGSQPAPQTVSEVRTAVKEMVDGRPVDVVVDDIEIPQQFALPPQ